MVEEEEGGRIEGVGKRDWRGMMISRMLVGRL